MKYIWSIAKKDLKDKRFSVLISIFFYLLAAVLAMLPAKILQLVIDEGFTKRNVSALLIYLGILLITYLSKSLFTYLSNKGLIEIGNHLLKSIKSKIYSRLMAMDLSFYSKNEVGFINARVEEISAIDILFSTQTIALFSSVLEFVLALVILFSINWKVLAILSIPIPFLFLITYLFSRKLNEQINKTLDSSAEYSGKIQDTLHGMETVKSQGLEKKESEKIDQLNRTALENQKRQAHTMNSFSIGMGAVWPIVTIIIYLIGGLFFISGDLTMGSFIAISSYASKLYSPILNYSSLTLFIQPAYLAMKRVSEFFFSEGKENTDVGIMIENIQSIEFKNIYFSYENCDELFHGLNAQVTRGEKVHLYGQNGSGKSTLLRLLLKLYAPQRGSIYVNGVNLVKIDRTSLVNCISYVSQRNYVFNDTVENNITYGIDIPDEARYQSIVKGLNLAEISERLARDHIETIGENGAKLSGGEIQKICLARALLLNKGCFILDEALSNLDKKSINYILEVIAQSDATWIVVDHQADLEKLGFKKIVL